MECVEERCGEGWGVARTDRVVGIELVGDIAVITAGHALANCRLHETGERRQHVNRRVDLPVH